MATSPLLEPVQRPQGVPDPYWVYVNHLKAAESQRTMRLALDGIAVMLMQEDGNLPEHRVTGENLPWWLLRQADTMRIQNLLASPERGFSAANVNKKLSALRGVLEVCWELGLMPAEDYLRAVRHLKTLPVGTGSSGLRAKGE